MAGVVGLVDVDLRINKRSKLQCHVILEKGHNFECLVPQIFVGSSATLIPHVGSLQDTRIKHAVMLANQVRFGQSYQK
jgi:hypothetical protein